MHIDLAMDMTDMYRTQLPHVAESTLRRVMAEPRIFPATVLELAGLQPQAEIRSAEEIIAMRLYRDALHAGIAAIHKAHVEDLLHNATANVKPDRLPYLAR